MSGSSTSLAAALENLFARVKKLDFDGLRLGGTDEYQRQAGEVLRSRFSQEKISNELHVDLLKLLQQLRNLDKTKLTASQLASMCQLIVKLGKDIAELRERGTLTDSAHLEIHLILILKSFDSVFPRHVDVVLSLYKFVRESFRRRYLSGVDNVMEKLDSYVEHIFSLTYNIGLNESKTRPKDKTWAYISEEALKLAPYSRKLLQGDISERVFVRFNAFKTGPLRKSSPKLERCFYSSMIEEFLVSASCLPENPEDDSTREYKRLLYLTAFSLSLQYMAECRSAKIDVDASALRGTLSTIRSVLPDLSLAKEESPLLLDAFDCAFWVLDGADFSALPPGFFRKTSNPLLGEIQFYALQIVPQRLTHLLDLESTVNPSKTPELSSYLAASWKSCFIPCKSSTFRLVQEIPRAFESHLRCRIFMMNDEVDRPALRSHIVEIDGWQKRNGLVSTLAAQATSFLDNVGVFAQKRGNVEFIAANYDKSIQFYELSIELYLHQHADATETRSHSTYGQESRLWPTHELLARAYELLNRRDECIDSLVRGIGLIEEPRVFNAAFTKATSFCARLDDWAGDGLCDRLFASKPASHSFPTDRFAMLTTELNAWKSSKRNSPKRKRRFDDDEEIRETRKRMTRFSPTHSPHPQSHRPPSSVIHDGSTSLSSSIAASSSSAVTTRIKFRLENIPMDGSTSAASSTIVTSFHVRQRLSELVGFLASKMSTAALTPHGSWTLLKTFPTKELTDLSLTIEDAGLRNAVVIARLN